MIIEDFLEWFQVVEYFFDYSNVPEGTKVKLIVYKLTSGASTWWDQMQHECRVRNQPPIDSWERMKRKLVK